VIEKSSPLYIKKTEHGQPKIYHFSPQEQALQQTCPLLLAKTALKNSDFDQ